MRAAAGSRVALAAETLAKPEDVRRTNARRLADERNDAMKVRLVMGILAVIALAGIGYAMLRYPWVFLIVGVLIGVMLVVAQVMGAMLGWGPGKTEGRGDK